ncbi:AraC family transcriptional regulator [Magnetospirillum molischianum]|uniref:Transcriptional regulator, AraC family n=1 Tax=Magnetospirillum molischianum DSM 120 TaxID=1150626 RepID=H8FQM4_MAGML|nr:AraC family transcriptional regulator [Magnetospirillum molischianum]CCG40662.1 Transcriptional regulator, AraC family [Magnetospirillum molischianum DSM 120]
MEKGTISILFVDAVLDGVRRRGFDADEMLEQVGLSPALLSHPHARVSSDTYTMLLRLIAQVLDDEFFGHDSRRVKVGSFAMMCHCVIHCRTLDKALARALRFFDLGLDDLRGTLSSLDGKAVLTLIERDPAASARIFAQETLLMFVHRLACWLVNRRIPLQWAAFRYARPPQAEEYRLMFSADLRFEQPETAVAFDPQYLALPVVRTAQSLKTFLAVAPENLLIQYKDSSSLAAQIQRRLRAQPPGEWPGFDDIALDMRLSVSTLRRRMEAEGQSYQAIKDHLRRDMAINLLSDTRLSVMDIAAELGFAETSAFHRAFKKWTGANPGEYRRSVSAPAPMGNAPVD